MIAPQFLNESDVALYSLPATLLRWQGNEWMGGGLSTGPNSLSSYAALDEIVARITDRKQFPDVKQIVIFGHSGGGAQSSLRGATGDSELYYPYLESIGAAMTDDSGSAISDAVTGSMCWCPITALDEADERRAQERHAALQHHFLIRLALTAAERRRAALADRHLDRARHIAGAGCRALEAVSLP